MVGNTPATPLALNRSSFGPENQKSHIRVDKLPRPGIARRKKREKDKNMQIAFSFGTVCKIEKKMKKPR